jgi:hypothetical protein
MPIVIFLLFVRYKLQNCSQFPEATTGPEPISYRGAPLSTLLHVTEYVFTQFAECTGTDCKQNGFTKITFQFPTNFTFVFKKKASFIGLP